MDCETYNLWRPAPDGSKVAISAAGDEDTFRVEARVTGSLSETWAHSELVPGPKTQVFNTGMECSFTIVMNVLSAPTDPIVLKASLSGSDGASLRTCAWQFTAPGSSAILIDVMTT
jgi:hypothetical protein